MSDSNQLPIKKWVETKLDMFGASVDDIEGALKAVSYNATCVEESRSATLEACQKLTNLNKECQGIKEKFLEQSNKLTMCRNILASRDSDLDYICIRITVLNDGCEKLEEDLAVQREKLMKSKLELQKQSSLMLTSSSEFLQKWNCTLSCGVAFRQQSRKEKLDDIKKLKNHLEQEMETFIKSKRAHENALSEKIKLESEIDARMKDLTSNLSDMQDKMQCVENKIQEYDKVRENLQEIYDSDRIRLESEIEKIKLEIHRMKSPESYPITFSNDQASIKGDRRWDSQLCFVEPKPKPVTITSDSKSNLFAKHNFLRHHQSPVKLRANNSQVTCNLNPRQLNVSSEETTQKPVLNDKCGKSNAADSLTPVSILSNSSQKFQFKKKSTTALGISYYGLDKESK